MARILIAGCGRIGTRLGLSLADQGHAVTGLRRRPEPLPAPLETRRADLGNPARLREALADLAAERVYYIAPPDQFADETYRQAFVVGLENLLGALPEPPGRLVFVSSTGVYGQNDGEWVDETSATEPASFSGRRLLEAEALVHDGAREPVVVRFGGIYGAGRERMLEKVRRGEPCNDDPPRYTNRIHEDDCVDVLAHLGALPEPAPVYLGVDSAPCTQCELMDWLAGRLGLPRPPRGGETPVRGGNKRCRNERLLASGYRLQFPTYREGYSAMLRAN
ncbi:SDR family oxidoreductase [Spiribacter halobius]|uniref:NAD(P)-dependent oxidoreductase n=1 Tax=Sediminicurvatus halobius TaxID=2182432 RepID=A0A2U2MWA0_9GAMM|nr:SDR family oxidoreductase [Spiribacter halobius]PWG61066.1 NAD(P)-dependent oxidoreductase [Spiribacter halobius]UEX77093.1 SDR family oxidoreductase [Spiribacter halobius]